ncbi:GT2 family glycosyltransferase [Comamonas odontotermitis]|uniref:GT2 family glycosyltransferase n=1 Tax=Comamonas odontotermitis TaxID=379895 RepID=A0ABR6RCE3_9BURK|nr:glycosyltransferase family 2 protein [Comamonas odontotermitis]MBB6576810.1 GT2 family glycosyltransferase [Comamonas odontotermitis]
MSSPLSTLRRLPHKLRQLGRSLYLLAADPRQLGSNSRKLWHAWRAGGTQMLKHQLLSLGHPDAPTIPVAPTDAWQDYQQRLNDDVLPVLRAEIAAMAQPVSISILVPTYNTDPAMLTAMVESVRSQIYPHWELCIADDASPKPHVRQMLQELAAQEPRIKLHLGETNRGVSHATNQALALASSPFVVLLDHDDLLQPQAIYRVAQCVLADDPDMLYSDEVLVSPDASQVLQYFHRPAFSPEYLRSHPYIVHMVGFRTALLRELGGFDEALTISQDYDLILRVSEAASRIAHIPEILYQWRTHTGSAGHEKMAQVMATSTAVLQRHLDRTGQQASSAPGVSFNFFETHHQIAADQRIAIIIPTKNYGHLVRQCVDSIRATVKQAQYDLIVIDHESTEAASLDYFAQLAQDGTATVLRYKGPFNFSAINNWAVRQLTRSYTHYLFCNNDIEALHEGWLEQMLSQCQDPSVGMVGAQLLYPDRTSIQHAGVCVGAFGIAEHYGKFLKLPPDRVDIAFMGRLVCTHEVSAVTAACLLMRKEAFDAIDGYDEKLAVGFGDVDLCLRTLQLGWRVLYCPQATLIHHESITRGKAEGYDPHPEDSALFASRWRDFLDAGDPYHHPAFEVRHTCWLVRTPMRCEPSINRRLFNRSGLAQRMQHLSYSLSESQSTAEAA